jgi:hypothetical protein
VAECETAREAWDTLAKIYKAKSNAMKLQLKRELNALKKDAAEPLTMYVGRAKNLRDQLKAAGSDIKDEEVALSLLAGLPSEYETIVTVLEASDGKLDLDNMLSKLLPVEQRVKPEETKAYFSNGQGAREDISLVTRRGSATIATRRVTLKRTAAKSCVTRRLLPKKSATSSTGATWHSLCASRPIST